MEVVVGIDFGSSRTGAAYTFCDQFKKDGDNNWHEIVKVVNFPNTGTESKTTTEIILDEEMNVLEFGCPCGVYAEQHGGESFYHFQHIKMPIYDNKVVISPVNSDHVFPLDEIIGKVLEYVSNFVLEDIRRTRPTVTKDKILWVLTIPAIWKENHWKLMREAALKGGLIRTKSDKQLMLVSEPEAAATWCLTDGSLDLGDIRDNVPVVVADMGGGTTDVISFMRSSGEIRQVSPPCGGGFGSYDVNKEFLKCVIEELFGVGNVTRAKKDVAWYDFENAIEDFKMDASDAERDRTKKIPCRMLEDYCSDDCVTLCENFAPKHPEWKVEGNRLWRIGFSYSTMVDQLKKIINRAAERVNEVKFQVGTVGYILLIGGLSQSEMMVPMFTRQFPTTKLLVAKEPTVAVVKGAVVMGLTPRSLPLPPYKGPLAVCAIDFGSANTGYAYSFMDNPRNIKAGKWEGTGTNESKTSTEIILTEGGSIVAFGDACKKKIDSLESDQYHFKHIKMNLYERRRSGDREEGMFIYSNNHGESGKKFDIKFVIGKMLKAVRDEALKVIREERPDVYEDRIKWVLTVPAIWDDFEKDVMMTAAVEAALIPSKNDKDMDSKLALALEPEAAAMWCAFDTSIDKGSTGIGSKYVIVDLGGGTADIVTHERESEMSMKEKIPPQGGNYGSNYINKLILEEIFYPMFGKEVFEEAKSEFYPDLCEMFEQIEEYKLGLKSETDADGSCLIGCMLLGDICSKKCDDCVRDFFMNYKASFIPKYRKDRERELKQDYPELSESEVSSIIDSEVANKEKRASQWSFNVRNARQWKIEFPYQAVHDFLSETISKINGIVRGDSGIRGKADGILEKFPDIRHLILVGGFNKSNMVFDMMKKTNPDQIIVRPSNPDVAVVKGAVIFGMRPSSIRVRVAKFTFGVGTYPNHFTKLIDMNEEIPFGDTKHIELMIKKGDSSAKFPLLCWPDPTVRNPDEPKYIDSKGVWEYECFEIGVGKECFTDEERKVILSVKFGATLNTAMAKHVQSGIENRAVAKFRTKKERTEQKNVIAPHDPIPRDPKTIDLCFLIDCTGSMCGSIRMAKDEAISIADSIRERYKGATVRLCFVGYRDLVDTRNMFEVSPFNSDPRVVKNYIEGVRACGGGGCHSNVFGGLEKALEQSWSAEARTLVHILDAPPHGERFCFWGDTHPGRPDMSDSLMKSLADKNIFYAMMPLGDYLAETERIFRESYKKHARKEILRLNQGQGHTANLFTPVMQAVSKSVEYAVASALKDVY